MSGITYNDWGVAMDWWEADAEPGTARWGEAAAVPLPGPVQKPAPLHLNKKFRALVNEKLPAHLLGAGFTVRPCMNMDGVLVDVVGAAQALMVTGAEMAQAGVNR